MNNIRIQAIEEFRSNIEDLVGAVVSEYPDQESRAMYARTVLRMDSGKQAIISIGGDMNLYSKYLDTRDVEGFFNNFKAENEIIGNLYNIAATMWLRASDDQRNDVITWILNMWKWAKVYHNDFKNGILRN
jgi:hypothetical protein